MFYLLKHVDDEYPVQLTGCGGSVCFSFPIVSGTATLKLIDHKIQTLLCRMFFAFYCAALVTLSSLTKLSLEFYVMEMIAITSFNIL